MTDTAPDTPLQGISLLGTRQAAEPPPDARRFHAVDPSTGEEIPPAFVAASPEQVEEAGGRADEAFRAYAGLSGGTRAAFLDRVADVLEARREAVIARAARETALSEGRLGSELTRTTHQLRMFARLIEDDAWRDPRVDPGDPDREPAPKPDVRSLRRALGPVAVFGSSNFPLAFSVAGGDTASALAAGCPVLVKAHPDHPGTSELVGRAIAEAARALELPEGVFSLLFDDGHQVGQQLVQLPEVQAVGFTGSRRGGEALRKLASARPQPIPVYAEMGSVNPIFVLPRAARARPAEIADGLYGSVTLGVGQFCTNPGVVLVPADRAGDALVERLAERVRATRAGTMLNARVCEGYRHGLEQLRRAGARPLASGEDDGAPTGGAAHLWEVQLTDTLRDASLVSEVFGPSALLVRYQNDVELSRFAEAMEGQLTATLHADGDELHDYVDLIDLLADRAGRLIVDQYPTGVEVGPAMVHGGPYPATSDGRSTSVGTRAIERFTRFVAYQNFPREILPEVLRGG